MDRQGMILRNEVEVIKPKAEDSLPLTYSTS